MKLPNDPYLYFGNLFESERQFSIPNFVGLALQKRNNREISHNLLDRLPFDDNSIRKIQAQDVFEHLPLDRISSLLDDIHRVLQPGGVFRMSVPDYHSPPLKRRSIYDEKGRILADLMMGGVAKYDSATSSSRAEFQADGNAHLWFPTYDQILHLIVRSKIRFSSEINFHHYFLNDQDYVCNPYLENEMFVQRAPPNDMRAEGKPISIIVDFVK